MRLVAAALLAAFAAPSAFASAYWTDWTSAAASSVSGTLSAVSYTHLTLPTKRIV